MSGRIGGRIGIENPDAVHLLDPGRLGRQIQVSSDAAAVLGYGGVGIPDMRAEVE
jgi:hypothetical protein